MSIHFKEPNIQRVGTEVANRASNREQNIKKMNAADTDTDVYESVTRLL